MGLCAAPTALQEWGERDGGVMLSGCGWVVGGGGGGLG